MRGKTLLPALVALLAMVAGTSAVTAEPESGVPLAEEPGTVEYDVLMLVGDADAPRSGELALAGRLQRIGLGVSFIADDEPFAERFETAAMVWVSASVVPRNLDPAWRSVTLPAVVADPDVWRAARLAAGTKRVDDAVDSLSITEVGTALSGGLAPGSWTMSTRTGHPWAALGELGPGGAVVATTGEDPVAVAYDAGDEGFGGDELPARRVGLGAPVGAFNHLTDAGWQLVEGIVDWVVSPPGDSPPEPSAAERIARDAESGLISPDDAARYLLYGALSPERVPQGYRPGSPPDHTDTLRVLEYWAEATEETRHELEAFLTPTEQPGSAGAAGSAVLAAPDPDGQSTGSAAGAQQFSDCLKQYVVAGVPDLCAAVVDANGTILTVYYAAGPGGVDPADEDANGRPDVIEDIVLRGAGDALGVYGGLGFDLPSAIDIVVPGPVTTGLALPASLTPVLPSGSIYLNRGPTRDLVHHEIFHQVQYQYVDARDIAAHFAPMTWWMEATAEWAAHQAATATGASTFYDSSLAHALDEPWLSVSRKTQLVGGSEYGSFIVAEFLEERFGDRQAFGGDSSAAGAALVRRTWEIAGAGLLGRSPVDAIADVVNEQGSTWREAIREYRLWTYVLERVDDGLPPAIGFVDPDVSRWRGRLAELNPGGAGRPGISAMATLAKNSPVDGRVRVQDSGAAYVELELHEGLDRLVVDFHTAKAESIWVDVLPMSDYPHPCQPRSFQNLASSGQLDLQLLPECDRVTLVITHAGQPGATSAYSQLGSGGTVVSWSAVASDADSWQTVTPEPGMFSSRFDDYWLGYDRLWRLEGGPHLDRYLTPDQLEWASFEVDLADFEPECESSVMLWLFSNDVSPRERDRLRVNGTEFETAFERLKTDNSLVPFSGFGWRDPGWNLSAYLIPVEMIVSGSNQFEVQVPDPYVAFDWVHVTYRPQCGPGPDPSPTPTETEWPLPT